MSNQIRILNQALSPDGSFSINAVFWLSQPANLVTPVPNFVSADPNIDTATWQACQEGTLVEQIYNSGQLPSGTTLASVESSLTTAYAAAQAALTDPPLALPGLTYNGSSWAALVEPAFFLRVPVTLPANVAAAMGLLFGVQVKRAAGYVNTSSTSNQPVRATTYNAPGSNGQRSLASSSANDTAAGTGARTVTITYLDSSFAVHTETVALNGIAAVPTVGIDIAYVESIVVSTVGSGGINAGTISLFANNSGGGGTVGSIAIGDQQTWWCHHYVPAGKTAYLVNYTIGSTVTGSVASLVHIPSLATPNAPSTQTGVSIVTGAPDWKLMSYEAPLAVPGPDLVYLNVQPFGSAASKAVGGFQYFEF